MGSEQNETSSESLKRLLKKINELPNFQSIILTGVHDKGVLGNTPLHVASIWGDIEAIKILLKAGAEINVQGEHGYTPLHEAVEQGHYEAVKLLIKKGSSISISDDDGVTPSQLAVLLGDIRIIELFKNIKEI